MKKKKKTHEQNLKTLRRSAVGSSFHLHPGPVDDELVRAEVGGGEEGAHLGGVGQGHVRPGGGGKGWGGGRKNSVKLCMEGGRTDFLTSMGFLWFLLSASTIAVAIPRRWKSACTHRRETPTRRRRVEHGRRRSSDSNLGERERKKKKFTKLHGTLWFLYY